MEDRSLNSSFKEVYAKGLERNEVIGDESAGKMGSREFWFFIIFFIKWEKSQHVFVNGNDLLEGQAPPVRARGEELNQCS